MIDLKQIGLTAYGIAQIIAGETDPTASEFKKICQRWQRWLDGKGLKTLQALEEDLDRLGYTIEIRRKN